MPVRKIRSSGSESVDPQEPSGRCTDCRYSPARCRGKPDFADSAERSPKAINASRVPSSGSGAPLEDVEGRAHVEKVARALRSKPIGNAKGLPRRRNSRYESVPDLAEKILEEQRRRIAFGAKTGEVGGDDVVDGEIQVA